MIFGLGLEKAASNPAILQRAFELNVSFFDTAPSYGYGLNEVFLGNALKKHGVLRDSVTISTKTHDRNPERAMKLLEASLNKLQTDYVDIWHLHDLSTPWDIKVFPALDKAKHEGKARYIGVTCNRDPDILVDVLKKYPFDYVMMTINVADKFQSSFINKVLPYVGQTKVIAMQVFMRGKSRYQALPYFSSYQPEGDHPICDKDKVPLVRYSTGTTSVSAKWVCPLCGYESPEHPNILQVYQDCVNYTASFPIAVMLVGVSSVEQLNQDYRFFINREQLTDKKKKELEARAAPFADELNFFKQPLKTGAMP